jgi:hypothetical protein
VHSACAPPSVPKVLTIASSPPPSPSSARRLCYRQRHPKERGLLAGAAAGGAALPLAAYPLAAAFFGVPGLRVALLCGAANSLAMWLGGFGLFASAGAAFPEQYGHIDGGTYRGEWLGMLKQGYGAYTYPSGARYEGGGGAQCDSFGLISQILWLLCWVGHRCAPMVAEDPLNCPACLPCLLPRLQGSGATT